MRASACWLFRRKVEADPVGRDALCWQTGLDSCSAFCTVSAKSAGFVPV